MKKRKPTFRELVAAVVDEEIAVRVRIRYRIRGSVVEAYFVGGERAASVSAKRVNKLAIELGLI